MKLLKNEMKSLLFLLTEECNWNCEYCEFIHGEQKSLDLDSLKYHFPIILSHRKRINSITLSGGEPGLLNQSDIDYIMPGPFNNISLKINTNGLFIKKFPEYIDNFSLIHYHPFNDFNDKTKINKYRLLPNIDFAVVVTNNNIKFLDKFIENNIELKDRLCFHIELYKHKNENISQSNIILLTEILKKHSIETDYDTMLNFDNLYGMQKACSTITTMPVFDFVNNKIIHCCVGIKESASYELNESNIKKLFDNTLFIDFDEYCKTCIKSSMVIRNQMRKYL